MFPRATIWILSMAILGGLFWASRAPLDIASHATGEVVPEGQLKRIQHLEGGIVEKIYVSEGDVVKKGQPLYELSPTASDATVSEVYARLAALEIRIARLDAQLKNQTSFTVPKQYRERFADKIAAERDVFEASTRRFLADKRQHELAMRQKEQELLQNQSRIDGQKRRLELIQKQVSISERLLKEQLVNDFDHLNMLKERDQIQSEIHTLQTGAKRIQTSLEEARSAIEVLQLEYEENLQTKLSEALNDKDALSERLKKLSDSLNRTVVRAPADGTVLSLFFVTTGGVVSPGGTLLTLVPETKSLVLNARLNIGDVGFVHPGQKVRISLAATSLSGISPIDGTVMQVSPDALNDEKTGPYYLVKIRPGQSWFGDSGNRYPLKPGLQVMTSILVGQRTVLGYFLEPLFGDLVYALNER